MKPPKEALLDRFLRYVKIDTRSDENSTSCPSTAKQWDLLRLLHEELLALGLKDATIDENGYVFATVAVEPAARARRARPRGRIPRARRHRARHHRHQREAARAQELQGRRHQAARRHRHRSSRRPSIPTSSACTRAWTSSPPTAPRCSARTTRRACAEVMTAVDLFLQNPDIPRGIIKVGFNPDEEIGRGADKFDVKRFGAEFAYTMDGGPLGEIEYETFNAYRRRDHDRGIRRAPGLCEGQARERDPHHGRFHHAPPARDEPRDDRPARRLHPPLPAERPERSRSPCACCCAISTWTGSRSRSDHRGDRRRGAQAPPQGEGRRWRSRSRTATCATRSTRSRAWSPMRRKRSSASASTPKHSIIRGGTDGARLSYMGLPCPNLFAGGEAIHSTLEWVPVQVMEKAAETIVRLSEIWAERTTTKQ